MGRRDMPPGIELDLSCQAGSVRGVGAVGVSQSLTDATSIDGCSADLPSSKSSQSALAGSGTMQRAKAKLATLHAQHSTRVQMVVFVVSFSRGGVY